MNRFINQISKDNIALAGFAGAILTVIGMTIIGWYLILKTSHLMLGIKIWLYSVPASMAVIAVALVISIITRRPHEDTIETADSNPNLG